MPKKIANDEIVNLINELASKPERVHSMGRATKDMFRAGLTIYDICDAICKWIADGNEIEEDVTRHASDYIGQKIYILKPHIQSQRRYVKVQIRKNMSTGEYLMIISAHECY